MITRGGSRGGGAGKQRPVGGLAVESCATREFTGGSRLGTAPVEQLDGVIGESPAMGAVFSGVRRLARSGSTVLIRGESGTGKQLIARAIHALGADPGRAFITVDCTNIPSNLMESELFGHEPGAYTDARTLKRGLVEMADGGSLLLDEIGSMPLELQGKLLGVLETEQFRRVGGTDEITVSVRFLAATNEDLELAVRAGRFRQDLYYRLNVIPIELPPLRDRGDDVILIAEAALAEFTSRLGVGPRRLGDSAVALLRHYSWPGNVRELRNVIERAVVMTDRDVVRAEDLVIDRRARERKEVTPGLIRIDGEGQVGVVLPPEGISLEKLEQELVRAALVQSHGSVTGAARLLDLTRDTLRYRLSKYGIDPRATAAS